jgi:O-antigen ligase
MIFPLAILATGISIVFLLLSPMNGVLLTLLFKPLIDASWGDHFFGVNALMLIGVTVPLLILPRIIFSRDEKIYTMPLALTGLLFFFSNVFGVVGLIAEGNYSGSIEIFFRALNGFLGFYMFQFFFHDKENFRKLILFLLLAGIFPVLVGIYQGLTGTVWQSRSTSLGLVRYVGLYHDAFSVRYFGFQTLAAIILSWAYFVPKSFIKKTILVGYGLLWCFVIFRGYSKAAIVIFIAWALIWIVFNKKFIWLIFLPIIILVFDFSTGNRIYTDTKRVFMKEIGAYDGTMESKYILAGRTVVWEKMFEEWQKKDFFYQFFGSGTNPPAHNEFLRITICNGILGLFIFFMVFIKIGWQVWTNILKRATPLNVMAGMIFVMWCIDIMGLHPGLYPAYQWFVFGFITLGLRGVAGLDGSLKHGHEDLAYKGEGGQRETTI